MNTSEQQPPTRRTHQIVELLDAHCSVDVTGFVLFLDKVLGKAGGHHLTRRALVPAKVLRSDIRGISDTSIYRMCGGFSG